MTPSLTAPHVAPDAPPRTSAWRIALLIGVLLPLTITMWIMGVAGMRAGLLRAGLVMIGVPVVLTWLLYRRRPTLAPALVWAGVVGAALTLVLWVAAPVMPDRLLAEFPAEAVPEGAVQRETATFGDGLQIMGRSSAIRWYEVPGQPRDVEAAVRRDLIAAGWSVEDIEDPLFDFRAVNPNATVEAAVAVGVDTPKQRYEQGSTEPLPRNPGNTILEISVAQHH